MKKIALCIIAIGLLAPGVVTTIEAATTDTVFVTPAKPTTRDLLHFRLRTTAHCCATVYRDTNVTVTDTVIMLRDNYDESLCANVRCIVAWSEANFSCKPLAAKKYAVYKVESMYCPPPRLCPMLITMPVRVGTLTVTAPTAISSITGSMTVNHGNELSITGSTLTADIAQNSRVTLRAFDVRGVLLAEIFNGWMSAGTNHLSLSGVFAKAGARGTVLVHLSIDGTVTAVKTIVTSHS
jgi:hypothetical protein